MSPTFAKLCQGPLQLAKRGTILTLLLITLLVRPSSATTFAGSPASPPAENEDPAPPEYCPHIFEYLSSIRSSAEERLSSMPAKHHVDIAPPQGPLELEPISTALRTAMQRLEISPLGVSKNCLSFGLLAWYDYDTVSVALDTIAGHTYTFSQVKEGTPLSAFTESCNNTTVVCTGLLTLLACQCSEMEWTVGYGALAGTSPLPTHSEFDHDEEM